MKQGLITQIAPIFSFFLLLSPQISAQINLQIQASQTTGIAPFYVFFDATISTGLTGVNDLVNADFQWNFDVNNTDPSGNWETVKGMVAGHVFEVAGTYTVQCTLTAPDGSTDTEILTITVADFTGTTYYVSAAAGDDTNDGLSAATPWQSANFAFSQLSANERILFNRGETFSNVHFDFLNLTGGKMIIGAYGSGSKPILSGLVGEDRMLQLDFVENLTFTDLHLISNTTTEAYNFDVHTCTDILFLNLELEGATGMAIVCLNSDLLGIFDAYYHDFGVMGTYTGDTNRFSLVGNTIGNLIGTPQPEHGIRVQGGEKQFLAHNILTNLTNTKTAMTIRGDGQRHVMIYRNKMDRLLGVNPQNAATVAAIAHVTIEGNYIGQNTAYTGTAWENSFNGINIEATNVAIRNNVIDGYHNAISVLHDYNGVVSGWVDVYHNTINWRPVSPISFNNGRAVRVRDVSDVNVKNNLITAPTVAEGFAIAYSGTTNTNICVANNIISTPNDYLTNPLPGSAAHQNDVSNYQITNSSAANNAGGSGIPVFFDYNNAARNSSSPDVGTFENQTALPLELLYFTGFLSENGVVLHWKTSQERNTDYFEIQRAEDGINFSKIVEVPAMGYSSEETNYQLLDKNPQSVNFYRLKMVDNDGTWTYSPTLNIQIKPSTLVAVYPNPTKDFFKVELKETTEEVIFELYDARGHRVIERILDENEEIQISDLPSGPYYWNLRKKQNGMEQRGVLYKL